MRARLFGLLVLWATTATAAAPVTLHPGTWVQQLFVAQASTQPLRISQAVLQMTDTGRPGPCVEVARRIFTAFQQLGGKPEFIRFTPQGSRYLAFEMRAGEPRSTVQLSDLSLHVAVRLQNKIYDAFTGPQGLPEDEYIRRLVTEEGMKISSAVLNSLDEP